MSTRDFRRAFRATVLNPVSPGRFEAYQPGFLTINDHKIESLSAEAPEAQIIDLDDRIIIPGLIDTHVHLPQFGILGLGSSGLLEWLKEYTYPEEARFADARYAEMIAEEFFGELVANGTTTASIYSSIHEEATDIAFTIARKKGIRAFIGKVMMDRYAPSDLMEDSVESLESSIRLFRKWDGADSGRLRYVFSPRYAGSCSRELMTEVARFAATHSARIQSHLSESVAEVEWVRSLFPESRSYTDIYASCGMLGPNTVLGHCIHLSDDEVRTLAESRTRVAFCPCSNRALRSGAMPYRRLQESGLTIGLGSDIAGGPTLSMFRQMGEALNTDAAVTPAAAFYHATLGAATALGVQHEIGSLEPGKDADFVVLKPQYSGPYIQPAHWLSRMCYLGDRDWVESVWIRGREATTKAPLLE